MLHSDLATPESQSTQLETSDVFEVRMDDLSSGQIAAENNTEDITCSFEDAVNATRNELDTRAGLGELMVHSL